MEEINLEDFFKKNQKFTYKDHNKKSSGIKIFKLLKLELGEEDYFRIKRKINLLFEIQRLQFVLKNYYISKSMFDKIVSKLFFLEKDCSEIKTFIYPELKKPILDFLEEKDLKMRIHYNIRECNNCHEYFYRGMNGVGRCVHCSKICLHCFKNPNDCECENQKLCCDYADFCDCEECGSCKFSLCEC